MKTKLFFSIILSSFCSSIHAQTYVFQVKPVGSEVWGYANIKGEIIIEPQYIKCYEFSSDGLAVINKGGFYFINLKGEKLTTEITEIHLITGKQFGTLNQDMQGYHDGLVAVTENGKWGYLNTEGKIGIPLKYTHVTEFTDGNAVVKIGEQFIVLNTKGEESIVSDPEILDVKKFSEGLAPYRTFDKQAGYIGKDGKIAIKATFKNVGYFHGGLAWAKTDDEKVGYINPKGEWVIKPQFQLGKDFDPESDIAEVRINDKRAYVSKDGKITNVSETDPLLEFHEGLAASRKNEKIGFLNTKMEWAIEPQFDGKRDFKNGYAAVKKDEKWGVIDKQGKWVVPPTFIGIKDVELVK